MNQDILQALEWRYATKTFDSSKSVSNEDLTTILESGRLAPSSFGIEPWKFIVVENPEVRAQLRAASFDQSKVTDASHLVIIARRTDGENLAGELITRTASTQNVPESSLEMLRGMVTNATGRPPEALDGWLRSQSYIALGMMIETAALLKIDTCPMEGFDPAKVDEILGLSAKHLKSTSMLAIGYRGDDASSMRAKVRRSASEVIEFVK
jgi:nitroreductase